MRLRRAVTWSEPDVDVGAALVPRAEQSVHEVIGHVGILS